MSERDTHFASFAELLARDIEALDDEIVPGTEDLPISYGHWKERLRKMLAQRAYDLVLHTLLSVEHINLDRLTFTEHVEKIPDITEWPEWEK